MEYMIPVEPSVKIFVNDINPQGSKTIFFIHGWPANHRMFEYQYNPLIKKGYRCIGFDTRGFGRSDKPTHGYDYNRLADDVAAVVRALKLRDFTLAGHSTGGAIALRYMGRHGGQGVSKLALLAAAAPSLVKRPGFNYGATPETVLGIIKNTYIDRPKMLSDFGDIFFHNPVSKPFAEWFFDLGLEAASWATTAIANDWLEETMFDDQKSVRVPTVIMHGIHDRVVPFELAGQQQEGIKNSRLIPFENSGHGLFYDEMERFNRELMEFAN